MPITGLISGGASGLGSAGDILTGGVTSLITGGINSLYQGIAQRRQYKNQKKLMKMAHEYELENLAKQDEYQRGLVTDAASMTKTGLMNAGYSTADPNGTGVSPASISGPSTSATGSAGSFPIDSGSVASGISALMSGQLSASQAKLNEIQAKYLGEKMQKEIDKLDVEIQAAKEKLPFVADEAKANISNLSSSAHLNEERVNEISANIDKLAAETKAVDIDNNYRADMNVKQLAKLQAETGKLVAEGRFEAAQAKLAEYGILAGADLFTTIAALSVQGKSADLVEKMAQMIKDVVTTLPGSLGTILSGVVDVVSDDAKKKMIEGAKKAGASLGSAVGKPLGAVARGVGLIK